MPTGRFRGTGHESWARRAPRPPQGKTGPRKPGTCAAASQTCPWRGMVKAYGCTAGPVRVAGIRPPPPPVLARNDQGDGTTARAGPEERAPLRPCGPRARRDSGPTKRPWHRTAGALRPPSYPARPRTTSSSRTSSSCSKPPVSMEQCMPHSLGAPCSHHQRPARGSSPAVVGRVQHAQEMLV